MGLQRMSSARRSRAIKTWCALDVQVKAEAEKGPDGEIGAAPAGFVLDPSSGYYYSAESKMYYDATSGGYFSSTDSRWYSYDPQSNQYVEWPDAGAANAQ